MHIHYPTIKCRNTPIDRRSPGLPGLRLRLLLFARNDNVYWAKPMEQSAQTLSGPYMARSQTTGLSEVTRVETL